MVSALWKACAADVQDVENVQQLLKEPGVDLEIKDQTGTTPLIQAVRNGHKDIVKALVAAGADINNASSQGKPETFTTDPEVLALLQPKAQTYEGYPPSSDPSTPFDPAMQNYYYPMPPGHEGPYPYPYPMMSPPDGQPMSAFPPQGENSPGGVHNLPPADVARTIPCRYFPVCRYGSSCMFLHPPASYFSGPIPPAPAHYPPMYQPHPYYMMRPGAYPPPPPPPASAPVDPAASPVTATQPFPPPAPISYPPPPNGAPPFSPATNGAPFPPPVNGAPFPNGAPYPPPTNGAPYPPPTSNGTPFSPVSSGTPYTPATNGTPSPYGPPPFSPGSATPYSAAAPYTPGPPVPYGYPRPYPDTPKDAQVNGATNGTTEEAQPAPTTNGVNGTGHHPNGGFARRGRGGRRESFGTQRQQKPPCLFFPLGRCRNGDECRFPHVPGEPGQQPNNFRYPSNNGGRFNGHRARQSIGHHDGPPPAHIPPGTKLPFAPGGQQTQQAPNSQQQRVPNADDFPVLKSGTGAERPPAAPAANGGLTAAQVLQAPAPAKKGKADSDVVGDLADAFSKVHVNGLAAPAFEAASTPEITAVGA